MPTVLSWAVYISLIFQFIKSCFKFIKPQLLWKSFINNIIVITLGPTETDNINYLADCKKYKRGWGILGKTETDNINYLADCKRYKRGWEIPGKTDHNNQVI